MADAGKLTLIVIRDGASLIATEVRSTRPMAALILKGKTPTQVLQIVPKLFSVCGKAQGAAASAALQAAQQGGLAGSALVEQGIVCEAIQEHLWRTMLDWPKLLGLDQQERQFTAWYALLRRIATGEVDMAVFRQELEQVYLGMPATEWRALDSYSALQTWWNKAHSPFPKMLARLDKPDHGKQGSSATRLLPAWNAAEAYKACGGRWDDAFSACPVWQDEAAETGPWSYFAGDKSLHEVWQKSGSKALARLLARLMDMVEMASGRATPRLDITSPIPGEGMAVVRTARGLLIHHVRLAAEKVTDYVIVAPTEWNFHPSGAFAQDMIGLEVRDTEHLQQLAHIAALSLDPCVAYEVEIRDA